MSELPQRPDPDLLLARLKQEEARARRGRLKVFFGFAPGVGKTYRMLQVARDLVADQHLDLVVGIVETHHRRETAAMTLGLELLPRRKIEYRGHLIEEFDLDRALARRPKAILVDELAHTNAPGMRHPKRWQDVEELLNAGIDVYTTMNLQHVESLNDVVAQITRIQVRETVPDSVLDGADSIELVDIAPEELLARLHEGKVYLPEQARLAADHFFQRGNLLALRELALRRTAQHVDDDVLEYRQEQGLSVTVPAGERILVCVGPAPSSAHLVRSAARLAKGLRCPWVAAYVEAPALTSMSESDRERLEAHLRLAESLGATVARLLGSRVAEALLTYARRYNVSRIVIGKPTHSRWRDRLRGSLLNEVVRGSADIDIQVISGSGGPGPDRTREPAPTAKPRVSQYAGSTLLVGATLAVTLVLRSTLALPDPEMLFLLAVMIAALWFGRGPALLAAGLGVAAYDFFFVPPFATFGVADRRYVLTFAMMFIVGILLSELAGRVKRQERDAVARQERTAVLYALSRDLSLADTPSRIAEVTARQAAGIFVARAVVLEQTVDSGLCAIGAFPADTELSAKELTVAGWAIDHSKLAGCGTDNLPGSSSICAPLQTASSSLGVLALLPSIRQPLRSEQRAFLDAFCRQVALAFERIRLAEQARAAALRAKTEEMRSSLLSAVSHDLRTPLASITGAATALRDDPNLHPRTKGELVESIVSEAERLEHLVTNLLDMTRLESRGVTLNRDWVPLDEIIGAALTRLEDRLEQRRVTVQITPNVPSLFVDPVLLQQLFINLLENADKYTPAGTPLEIAARCDTEQVVIDLRDHGPGLPSGAQENLFDKFVRGPHAGIGGAGLGLAICRAIAQVHGGTLFAENHAAGGAVFHLTLPIGGEPPVPLPPPGDIA